jgi:hypothetical protein
VGLAAAITLIVIATHQSFYIAEEAFSTYKIPKSNLPKARSGQTGR